MWTPESVFFEGVRDLGMMRFRKLELAEANSIKKSIEEKFAMSRKDCKHPYCRLFERLINDSGMLVFNKQAWQWFRDYPEPSSVLAFFEKDGKSEVKNKRIEHMFEFESIKDLIDVYSEGPIYTIYITNRHYDYLLAYTVEDSIIAAGVAMDWLDARLMQEKRSDTENEER